MKKIPIAHRSAIGVVLAAAFILVSPAHAQDRTNEIDKIFSWATPATPGCAVGVAKDGIQVVNRAYGLADLERDVPINPNTVFDIGSVQKQFTAAAVLLLAEEGRLSLTDDVRKHIPELPDYGHTITADHLLTHTSGLRDWTGLAMLSSGDGDILSLILRQRGLNFPPGDEWSYSNSGYELLKEIVARTSGMPFPDFVRTRLFEPLGMESTVYRGDLWRVIENRALAYEKEGDRWKLAMRHLDGDRGRGAIFSTASDLLIWNEALTNARLSPFVTEKIQEPARLNDGRELGYARGLFLWTDSIGRVVWHTGSAAGYNSFLARYPEQGLSIAIHCNAGDSSNTRIAARRIFDLFVPGNHEKKAEPGAPGASADAEDVNVSGRAGLFFSEDNGQLLHLIVDEGRLRVAGGPPLVAVTDDRFRNPEGDLSFRSGDEFELHFVSPDVFELVSMEGETTRYRRARPYEPAADALQAFSGHWESEELNAVFQITPGDRGLMIRLNGSPTRVIEFFPVDTDTFLRGRMMVRFQRDEDGKVVALNYSNPALRNIPFTRLSDGPSQR